MKPIMGKKHPFQMEPVVEPNEESQLDFAGPLPNELNKDAYVLVVIDKSSKLPTTKVVFEHDSGHHVEFHAIVQIK